MSKRVGACCAILLGSPLLAGFGSPEALAQSSYAIPEIGDLLNVFDFEIIAKQKLPPAYWGHLATGVDDETTIAANRSGFARYQLRVRRMVDVSAVDMSVNLFGARFDSPIVLAPVSSQNAFYPDAESICARAAKIGNHLQILSTLSSASYEVVNAARGGGLWFQKCPSLSMAACVAAAIYLKHLLWALRQ